MKKIAALVAVAAAAVALGGCARMPEPPSLRAGTVLPQPRPLGELSLQDAEGRAFGRPRLTGRWSLVFTGFTHCPDVCPATLGLLGMLRKRVPEQRVQFVFLSVDPARDTPEVLRRYLARFGGGIVGVTAAPAELARFTRELGLGQVINPGADGHYTVDHSTALVLIDPEARVAGHFTAPHALEALAEDLAAL